MPGGRVQRGWALAKLSYHVLAAHRSLLLFPVLAAGLSIVTAAVFFGPAVVIYDSDGQEPILVLFGILTLYALSVITLFFNTALAAAASDVLAGRDADVWTGVDAARDRLGPIAQWALVSTTVGLVIAAVESLVHDNILGRLLVGLADFAWAVATFFVVPVIALEGVGPRAAFKRSVALLRQRWGEGVVGSASISGVILLVALPVLVVFGGGGYALLDSARSLAVLMLVVAGLVLITAMVGGSTLQAVFRVALYEYATTGETPREFESADLAHAFQPKSGSAGRRHS